VCSPSRSPLACLGGCGGSAAKPLDRKEYLQQIREISAGDEARTASRLFFELVADPPLPQEPCRERARNFHEALGTIVDAVEQLDPPADMALLQRQFVEAARQSVRAVGQAADDVGTGKLRCGRAMNRRIYGLASTQQAEGVLREYAKHGYVFGLNSQD
jgi:hypothetical protein